MYSTADRNVSTFDIFLFFAPLGTCCLNVANPMLTIFTRFLSRSFLRATVAGWVCGNAYPNAPKFILLLHLNNSGEVNDDEDEAWVDAGMEPIPMFEMGEDIDDCIGADFFAKTGSSLLLPWLKAGSDEALVAITWCMDDSNFTETYDDDIFVVKNLLLVQQKLFKSQLWK